MSSENKFTDITTLEAEAIVRDIQIRELERKVGTLSANEKEIAKALLDEEKKEVERRAALTEEQRRNEQLAHDVREDLEKAQTLGGVPSARRPDLGHYDSIDPGSTSETPIRERTSWWRRIFGGR